MKYLDASIPLCVETEEPSEKLDDCTEIMRKIEEGKEKVVTSAFTPAEIFYILAGREGIASQEVKEIFEAFFDSEGLKVIEAEGTHCHQAIELALERGVDFVNAHHVLTMKEREIDELYTIDPHFDRFPEVTKLEQFRE
ncbi:hypothetical protein AKJ57_04570 [candidate division MSBL1 archaeon SCGC-AAA259A05]|uniref:PIN domain-containing protein n=1 Tax=candidate division MSBL1 archaeon SCGC-AAA259A05 TaxID=1698259 RepID=A0A133U749_9EURY|nr:hypothetical protein AKJ57_04570 [candidate division MSBL1 archaeon SCGC-AAA259A05]